MYGFFIQMNSTSKLLFWVLLLAFSNAVQVFGQTANITTGCSPLEVNFTAPVGSTTFYWDFKDGVTSNLQNPTSVFTQAGTYNVEFRETIGGPVLGTIPIKIYPDPRINIAVPAGCAPLNAQFQNTSVVDPGITILNYVWVFGDGTSSQGVQNVSHVYSNVGFYDVSFSIQTNYPTCNRTVIFSDVVEVITPPVASYTTNPASLSLCSNSLPVSFTNTSTGVKPLTYLWNLGNGVTSTLSKPPNQTYPAGQYTASLTTSYAGIVGCASSTSKPISVGSPIASIRFVNDTVCVFEATPFYTKTLGTYAWNFGPNVLLFGSTSSDSLKVMFTTAGFHTVTLKVTSLDGLCSSTKTVKIFVDEVTAKIVSTPSFSCSSPVTVQFKAFSNKTNVKYDWILSNTVRSTLGTVSSTFTSATASSYYGINEVEYIWANLKITSKITGCYGVANKIDSLWLPNARFMPDVTKGCFPLTVKMSDSSTTAPNNPIISREWLFGDGTKLLVNNNLPVTHVYTAPGSYLARLLVKTQKGCVDTSYAVLIEVGKDLTSQLNFSADKTDVCPGEEVNFTALVNSATAALIDAYHFGSEGNRLFHCSSETVVPWSYTNLIGPQDVKLTVDYNGCFSTITKTAFVNVKGAIAKLNYAGSCDTPLEYVFKNNSLGATNVLWSLGDTQSSTSMTNIIHTYAGSGRYSILLTASDPSSGCAATQDTTTIEVRQIKAKIQMDTLWCARIKTNISGALSTDVRTDCSTAYTWQILGHDARPFTSTNANPQHQINAGGNYTVKLVVQDINGCKDTTYKNFKVFDIHSNWTADKLQVCAPNSVQFTDASLSDTTLVAWNWTFGDVALNTSSIQNPSVFFSTLPLTGAIYNVRLTIKDKIGCADTVDLPLQYYSPVSSIGVSDNTLCLGESVTFTASDFTSGGSNLNFTWDFGNSQTSTTTSNTILYTNAQVYTIKLKYTESGSGCKDSTSINLEVQNYPQAAFFTNVDSLTVLCAPQNVFFTDSTVSTSPVTYNWDFGNGQNSTAQQFALFYAKGTYKAKLIVQTSNGCADTTEQSFKVFSPEGDFLIDKNTICKGEEVTFSLIDTTDVSTYTWAFGDGTTIDNIAPVTHNYNFHPISGQAPSRLIIRGVDGICPVELQKIITIRQVIANFDRGIAGDTSLCFNDGPYPFINTSISADTYHWDFGDMTTSTVLNPIHQYPSSGVYDVELRISNTATGCVDTITKQAVIYDNPIANATGDTVCVGSPVALHVINPISTSQYLWTPGTGLSSNTSINPIATLNHTLVYNLLVTDVNSCTDNISVPAVIIEHIDLANLDTSIVIGDKVTLNVFGPPVYIYTWSPTEGLSCLDCNYPVIQPLKDITYNLNVKDVRGCFSDDYFFKIQIRPETFVKLPTSFTPNGDGSNDVLYVQGWGIKDLLEFSVYNRWGQQIYVSNNIKEGWDGSFNGILQNSDVYVYKVKALTWRNDEVLAEGYVNLLH